ncbi:MAG: glycosyl hydrolase family 95 catalytic domain-containing protein, partial [Acutalibacteraceae bacterium]
TNARKLLGCRGLLAAGNTPGATSGLISALSYYYPYQYVTGEEGWMLYPFWEYYQVTGDEDFLRERLYPLLRQMGDFYEDFLTETDENGHYIFAGSISPENQPAGLGYSLVNNSAFDIAGARFTLETLIKVCDILGTEQGEAGGAARWQAMLDKFPPYRINEDGALQEWAWEGLQDNYNHRHSSHLVGVWPYRAITPEADGELFDAAGVALAKRDAHFTADIGHGILHDALIAAGLKNAASLSSRLHQIAAHGFYYDGLITSHNGNHNTFCTDACHAVPAIMMEMLCSSDDGVLELLPALADGLKTGSIRGMKARNRTTVENLAWNMGENKVTATLRSDVDQTLTLIERQGIVRVETDAAISRSSLGRIARQITLKAGQSTDVTVYLDEDPTAVERENLALGKTATASGQDDPARTPDKAVDGRGDTRWASNQSDDAWLTVDLGEAHDIREIQLDWEAAYAKSYRLQVSDDGKTWRDLYETEDGRGGSESIEVDGRGRYLRMQGRERVVVNGSKWGYSLWEMRVYEQAPPSADGPAWQMLGDVDDNGKVEAADALMALQAATDKIELDELQADAADVTGEGQVTAADALMILQFATGKITSFC